MSSHGKFITLEGPEGCGKSTHAKALVERMTSEGYPTVFARDPGDTRVGEAIRCLLIHDAENEPICPETELFLFLASRAQLVKRVVLPALEKGMNVVCDRFADSTTAYQGYGRGCDLNTVLMMNHFAVQGQMPDITILLDIDVNLGFQRLQHRNAKNKSQKDRIEREALAFHEQVRVGYLELAKRWPERIRCINASGEIPEVDDKIWRIVHRVIKN